LNSYLTQIMMVILLWPVWQ